MAAASNYWSNLFTGGLNLDPATGISKFSASPYAGEEALQRRDWSNGWAAPVPWASSVASIAPFNPQAWAAPVPWNPAVGHPPVNINIGGAVEAGGANPGNPNQTLRNVKDPNLQSSIDTALGQYNALSTDFQKNPFVVRSNVKDPAQQARIDAAGGQLSADNASNRASLADFTSKYLAGDAAANANQQQESGAITDWYNGTVQSQLAQLAAQRKQAVAGATAQALARQQRMSNVARLAVGPSSYINQQGLDASAGIMAQEAVNQADLGRNNLLSVKDQQGRLAGLRSNLLNTYLMRGLAPIQATQQVGNNELQNLGQIGAAGEQNNVYQLDSPEAQMQRRLGILGNIQGLNTANNFYGLSRFEPGARYPTIQYPGMGGGGGDYGLNDPRYGGNAQTATNVPNVGGQQISPQVRQAYQAITGQDPASDPNLSTYLLNQLYNQYQASGPGYGPGSNYLAGRPGWQQPAPLSEDDIWASLGAG